jgi:hypothetical protein
LLLTFAIACAIDNQARATNCGDVWSGSQRGVPCAMAQTGVTKSAAANSLTKPFILLSSENVTASL